MKKSWRNNVEFYLIGLLLLMVIAFSIAMPNIFWSVSNFQSIASQMPVLGILALAMAMTMLCGGINLSIIATANACSLVMAWVATSYPPGGATALATLLAGGGAAMIIGLCNGILIAGIRVSPILATLGMMTLLKGINILITGGSAIANYPQWVLWLNHAQWFGIPLPMWLFAVGGGRAVGAAGEKPAGSGDHVDRIQRTGDPLFRDQYPAGVDVGICHLGPALRGGCVSDDVEAELSQSILWGIVFAGVDPRGGAWRRESGWR